MSGFYGEYEAKLDDKGRFPIPAKLRSVKGPEDIPLLDGNLYLTKGLEGCLAIYPEAEWDEIQRRMASLNFTQRNFRFFSRKFYSSANPVQPDKIGRILIPANLMKEAGIEPRRGNLLVLGVNRWIEIWNPVKYQYYLEQFKGSYEEVAEQLFSGDERDREV